MHLVLMGRGERYMQMREVIEDMHIAHSASFRCVSIAPLFFTYKTNASSHFDTFFYCCTVLTV